MNWQGDGFWNGQKQYLVYFWFHLQSGSSGASSSWGIQPPLLEFLPPLLLLPHIFLRLSLGLYFLHILHQNLLLCCSFLISILILFLQLHLPPFPSSPPPPLSPPPPPSSSAGSSCFQPPSILRRSSIVGGSYPSPTADFLLGPVWPHFCHFLLDLSHYFAGCSSMAAASASCYLGRRTR